MYDHLSAPYFMLQYHTMRHAYGASQVVPVTSELCTPRFCSYQLVPELKVSW